MFIQFQNSETAYTCTCILFEGKELNYLYGRYQSYSKNEVCWNDPIALNSRGSYLTLQPMDIENNFEENIQWIKKKLKQRNCSGGWATMLS